AVVRAIVERRLARPVAEIVAVLYGRNREVFRRRLDLRDIDFGEASAADHPVPEQRLDRVELLVRRHARVDAVQLPEVDGLNAKPPAALVRLLDQIFGPPEGVTHTLGPVRANPPLVAIWMF